MKPTLLRSPKPVPKGNFVCPWCGSTFLARTGTVASLEQHWSSSKRCARNKNVSNQTQSKNMEFDAERVVPGEATLRLVASRTTLDSDD